jgi:hypothetical protein
MFTKLSAEKETRTITMPSYNLGNEMNTNELIDEAVSLPVEKRILIVDSLLQSLNQPNSEDDKKWNEVAQQRLLEMRSGEINLIPGEQVFKNIWEKFET